MGPTRLLYLSGKSPDKDAATLQQLSALGQDVHIAMVASASDVLTRLRDAGSYHALLISHTLPAAQTLSIIASLRKATAPIAIVPVVTESQRELSTSAIAIGADDTLILLGGTLLHPVETLVRAKQIRHVTAHPVDAGAAPDHGGRIEPQFEEAVAPAQAPAPSAGVPPPGLPTEEERRQMRMSPRAELESALGGATADLKRAVSAHDADRAAWDAARQALESRVSELEETAAQSTVLEAALSHATAELRDSMATQIADRAAWETTRHDLERTIGELEAANQVRGELEFALAGARAELRKIAEAQASERAAWGTARRQLETHLHKLDTAGRDRADLEQALKAADDRLRQALAAHQSDRSAWEEARGEFERRLAGRNRDGHAPPEIERGLEQATAEIGRLRQAHEAECTRWEAERAEFERRVDELDARARTRAEADASLEAAHADLARVTGLQAAEQAAWDATRRGLESRLTEVEAIATGLRLATEAHEAHRRSWETALRDAEQRAADLEAKARTHAEVEASLEAARGDLRRLIDAHATERAGWGEARQRLERNLHAAEQARATDQVEWAAARAPLEQRLVEAASSEASLTQALSRANSELADLGSTVESLKAELKQARSVQHGASEEAQAQRSEFERLAARHDRLARSDLFGYGITTIDGWLVHCNDAFARIFGYPAACDALAAAADRESPGVIAQETIPARSIPPGQVVHRDSSIRRADDRRIRVLEAASLVPGGADADPQVERVVIDLSERDALEEHLRQARRLEAVGRLAASIAPDIDALASLVNASAAQFAEGPAAAGQAAEFAAKLRACAAETIPQLRQLLAFSRKQARVELQVNLSEAVERSAPVLARLVSSHVEFSVRHGESGVVAVDEEDLEQMLTTLVVTARDLLPAGGSLVIETGTAAGRHGDGPSGHVRPGLVLAVTASGRGVQPATASPSLSVVADRCGAMLQLGGTPGKTAEFRMLFTRCGG